MTISNTEAILLKSVPFKEKDQIIQALTKDLGIQTFYVKKKTVILPSLVEIEYQTTSSIYRGLQLTTLKSYDQLRTSFSSIKTTGKMLNYFQKTQLPGMRSSHLFSLIDRLLEWLNQENHLLCLSLFFTKILKFEGSFAIKNHCSICNQTLKRFFIDKYQWLCESHNSQGLFFSLNEIAWIEKMIKTKKKEVLLKLPYSKLFCDKLEKLFRKHFEIQGDHDGNFSRRRDANFV